jgi:hypothetical protein
MDSEPSRIQEIASTLRAARLNRIAGWIVFAALILLGFVWQGWILGYAKTVGLVWVALYYIRFATGDAPVSSPKSAVVALSLLVLLWAGSDWLHRYQDRQFEKELDVLCIGVETKEAIDVCDRLGSAQESWHAPMFEDEY